jgi:hypothetical protein
MNWRRGLFRLWTALFVLAVALVSYGSIETEFDCAAAEARVEKKPSVQHPPPGQAVTDPDLLTLLNKCPSPMVYNPWLKIANVVSIAFGIPLVVLVLGSSLVWAFSGFAAKRK